MKIYRPPSERSHGGSQVERKKSNDSMRKPKGGKYDDYDYDQGSEKVSSYSLLRKILL